MNQARPDKTAADKTAPDKTEPDKTADSSPTAASDAAPVSPEELRADIERTREQLGDTVEALVARTDIKAMAQHQATAARQRASGLARGIAGQVAWPAVTLAALLEAAAARLLPPTTTDPARPRRAAQRAAAGFAALAAATGLIAARHDQRSRTAWHQGSRR